MRGSSEQLSRAVSHALRHEPWFYELELDDEGWVPIVDLAEALRRDPSWKELDPADLIDMVATADKKRHEINGDRIRALYGHSLPGRIAKSPGTPPGVLFHGTAQATVLRILAEGLSPMGRQFVHLSVDRETAMAVGRRKSSDVAVLTIDAASADADGVAFLRGNDAVWLAEHVPARFVSWPGGG